MTVIVLTHIFMFTYVAHVAADGINLRAVEHVYSIPKTTLLQHTVAYLRKRFAQTAARQYLNSNIVNVEQ